VWSGAAGPLTEGEGQISWSGKDLSGNKMEEGNYRFTLEGQDSNGEPIEVLELVVGIVDEMSFANGIPTPSINGIAFDLGTIVRVVDPEDGS
jgi:flagellar hook assembly protein FlgD